MGTDDYEATFRQPARRAWLELKKFFEHYKVHMWITEELDTSGRRPYPENDQLGMRIEITYRNMFFSLVDYLANDEYAEYYTLGHWIGKDKWLGDVTPEGKTLPTKVRGVLKKLSKILDAKDQIELSRNTLYVHGVPMITLRSGLDARSFTDSYPILNSERC